MVVVMVKVMVLMVMVVIAVRWCVPSTSLPATLATFGGGDGVGGDGGDGDGVDGDGGDGFCSVCPTPSASRPVR